MLKSLVLLSLLVASAAPLRASVIQNNDHIPLPAAKSSDQVVYNTSAGQYRIGSFFDIFTDLTSSPPSPGTNHIDSFFDVFVEFDLQVPGGAPTHVQIPNSALSQNTIAPAPATGTYDTEMLSLNISGGGLPPGVMIRESPTLASTGKTSVTDIGGGQFRIDSFFDIFTELSIDGGASWTPGTSSMHTVGLPEPTALSLLAIGGIALLRRSRRA